jgi:hypothetical protein
MTDKNHPVLNANQLKSESYMSTQHVSKSRSTKPSHHPAKPGKRDATAPVTIDTPTGSLVQYERFLPDAMKLAPADIRSARINVTRVLHNAAVGAAAVLAQRDAVAEMPNVSIDAIESLAGMGFAARQE